MTSLRSSFFQHVGQTSVSPDGFVVSRAEGIYLFDADGKAYMDCISGIAVSSFGHQHPAILQAIRLQLDHHLHTMVYGEHVQQPQVSLAEKMASILPASLSVTYFTNSGTEAVEGALTMARKYTGRYEIMACRNAYHGSTAGAESLRSDLAHTSSSRPLVPGVRHIQFNDIRALEKISTKTAAVIIEPIQGEAGVIVPDPDYLPALQRRCRETGTLLILDEIQTGMGRTGSLFSFLKKEIIPDILLVAKAFGGGLPLGAFISSPAIMDVLAKDPPLAFTTTFGGHPLSCAASLAALSVLENESLSDNAQKTGEEIKHALANHPALLEVRGEGLMLAVELKSGLEIQRAVAACRQQGLLVDWFLFNDRSLRVYPPLTISKTETQLLIEKIAMALDSL